MAKMMSPKTTIWWVPADATETIATVSQVFNPDAPQKEFLTPARNISCAIVSGYTVNPTDSDTDDSKSICDASNVQTPTFRNYEGNITFFRDADVTNITSDYGKAFAFFRTKGTDGYIVRRLGKLSSVAPVAGDVVSSFRFINGNPQDVVNDGGPIQFTVPFFPQGKMALYKSLV